ncbi:hypothetical protein M9H77_08070 [Catharanthus roseus]|uniref:Uncharacterized protein n=1 Tax=Catharanthus roseus TaxID=4058 RepID=A0ACC0BWR3_CATRO|nr:hypothetical protein M9H77_08070 [Catharanthus roseus]
MGLLVAKQPSAQFPPINKGIPMVERSWKRHSSLRQVKSSPEALPKSSLTKIFLKIQKAPAALQSINHPQSPFDLRRSFQALKSTLYFAAYKLQNLYAAKS